MGKDSLIMKRRADEILLTPKAKISALKHYCRALRAPRLIFVALAV